MIVWNDIEHLTKNYNSGLKKLDGLNENEKLNKNKTNHNKNKCHFNTFHCSFCNVLYCFCYF